MIIPDPDTRKTFRIRPDPDPQPWLLCSLSLPSCLTHTFHTFHIFITSSYISLHPPHPPLQFFIPTFSGNVANVYVYKLLVSIKPYQTRNKLFKKFLKYVNVGGPTQHTIIGRRDQKIQLPALQRTIFKTSLTMKTCFDDG